MQIVFDEVNLGKINILMVKLLMINETQTEVSGVAFVFNILEVDIQMSKTEAFL